MKTLAEELKDLGIGGLLGCVPLAEVGDRDQVRLTVPAGELRRLQAAARGEDSGAEKCGCEYHSEGRPEPAALLVPIGNHTETDLMAALESVIRSWPQSSIPSIVRAVAWLHSKFGPPR